MEEKRRHQRFPASEMSFVVGLEHPGHIQNISEGGLGVKYQGGEELPDVMVVDLLHATKSIVLDRVQCRKVRDEKRGRVAAFSYVSERLLGLEFLDLSPEQAQALALFRGIEN